MLRTFSTFQASILAGVTVNLTPANFKVPTNHLMIIHKLDVAPGFAAGLEWAVNDDIQRLILPGSSGSFFPLIYDSDLGYNVSALRLKGLTVISITNRSTVVLANISASVLFEIVAFPRIAY